MADDAKDSLTIGKVIRSCETVLGKVNDIVECDYFGEEIEIGFNYRYLHDAVSRCECEEIELKMNSPFNPLIANSTEDDSYLYMVLPVRIWGNKNEIWNKNRIYKAR